MKTQKEIFVNSLVITQRESSHLNDLITQKNGKEEREEGHKRGRGEPRGVAYLRVGEINTSIPRLLGACCSVP